MILIPDISFITEDPSLGAQCFVIRRDRGKWVNGRYCPEWFDIHAVGNIQPASPEQVSQVPEGDRKTGMLSLWTKTPLVVAGSIGGTVSDMIVWQGSNYKIAALSPWNQFGFNVATLVRM